MRVLRRDAGIVWPAIELRWASDEMLTCVEFRSGKFPPLESEAEQINPDLWGKRLADFLREHLASQGFETDEPIPEDWGWYIPILHRPFRMWIGCGHYQDHEDSYLCFIGPEKTHVWRGLRRVDTRQDIGALQQAIERVLSAEPSIYAKRWWTAEDFNSPDRRPLAERS